MVKRSEYDQWVIEWIAKEKAAGRKCFDVKKSGDNYYVYYQSTRYNAKTKKREKVSGYLGKLVKGEGLVEPDTYEDDFEQVSNVRFGLGIDTGGTFTDAVIVDLDDYSVIAKEKSPTTHHDLSIGLYKSVEKVFSVTDVKPTDISLVGISTTLATNSILEGKGGEVGLILIGWKPTEEVHFGEKNQAFIKGGYDANGRTVTSLSEDEAKEAIMKVSQGVDAIAISGLFGCLNPTQEKRVKELAMQLTGLPVVAGHELSAALGIDKRAETAVLNGKLIPVVKEFFDDVEATFQKKGIVAPIMAYKGDGSVMTLNEARQYPVETILSGPAASSMGGKVLSGVENCVMVDIGGTSTDIAIMEEGFPQIQFEGASVGKWRTRVKAVDMYTVALGGDSRIRVGEAICKIGPERVIPFCRFAEEYPDVKAETWVTDNTDYYVAVDGVSTDWMTEKEKRVYEAVKGQGPLSTMNVREKTNGLWVIDDELASLVSHGAFRMSALTPTDVMVFNGQFKLGDPDAARIAIHAAGDKFGMTEKQAAKYLFDEIKTKVADAVMSKMLDDQMMDWRDKGSELLLRRMITLNHDEIMNMKPKFRVPIIGIGAPSAFMMEDLDKRVGAEVLFPENHDVGNAVGAVCSKITESLSATVIPTPDFRFLATVPFLGSTYYTHIDSAIGSARRSLESYLESKLRSYGAKNIVTTSKIKTYVASEGGVGYWDDEHTTTSIINFVEVISRAVGDPPSID